MMKNRLQCVAACGFVVACNFIAPQAMAETYDGVWVGKFHFLSGKAMRCKAEGNMAVRVDGALATIVDGMESSNGSKGTVDGNKIDVPVNTMGGISHWKMYFDNAMLTGTLITNSCTYSMEAHRTTK